MKLKTGLLYMLLGMFVFFISLPFFVNLQTLEYVKQEGFFMEIGSAVMFLMAGLMLLLKGRYNLSAVLFLAFARELDWHRFLGDSFLKKHYYTDDTALNLKLIGGFLIIIIATILIRALIKYIPFLIQNLLKLKAWAIMVCFSFGFIFVAKLCDEANRFFRDKLHAPLPKDTLIYITYIEETLEFLAGPLILMSIILYFTKPSKFRFK